MNPLGAHKFETRFCDLMHSSCVQTDHISINLKSFFFVYVTATFLTIVITLKATSFCSTDFQHYKSRIVNITFGYCKI
jgi:hypothetical protein